MGKVRFESVVCVGFLLFAGAASLSGCGGAGSVTVPSPTPGAGAAGMAKPADISGTYTLVSINGAALPYTMTHEPPGVRVTAGAFKIHPDGTCSSETSFVLPSGESMSRAVNATWARDGARLTMSWQGAGVTIGTVEGDTFTMDNEGQRLAYRKSQ